MKTALALTFAATLAAATAQAEQPKTYQVTGPVVEVKDDMIIVKKGKELWQLARTADTKVNGELKPGAKVTIEYRMTAASVEVKGAGAAAKTAEKTEAAADKAELKAEKAADKTAAKTAAGAEKAGNKMEKAGQKVEQKAATP